MRTSSAALPAATFTATFPILDWTGAWRDAFARLVAVGSVDPAIRLIFIENWRCMKTQAPVLDRHKERDFDADLDLIVCSLRLQMPPLGSHPEPLVLYRGQRA